MDPVSMMVISTVATTAAAGIGAYGTMQQASAGKKAAAHNAQMAERRANEELTIGQNKAEARERDARLAAGSLLARAGASGAGANDKTVLDLFGDIGAEGKYNSGMELASGQAKAQGIKHQADLDLWRADANKQMAKVSAVGQMIGAVGDAAGGFGKMQAKYGSYSGGSSRAWGSSGSSGWRTTTRSAWAPTVRYG